MLNAGYGALANKHFTYFRVENAESITSTGQMVNRWTSERTNILVNKLTNNQTRMIINNDTDSVYLSFEDVVNVLCPDETDPFVITDKLDQFIKEIVTPDIQNQTQALCEYLNNCENKMVWAREVISPVSINIAKKRYAMLVTDSEGVRFSKPKLKIIGLESKRSSTPKWAKKGLEHCYQLALEDKKDEMHRYITQFEKDFYKMPVSDIAIPRSVSSIEKYMDGKGGYIKGTPKHVKAAILHNRIIDERNIAHVDKLKSGNKFKFVELIKPNPYNESVIGFLSYLPKEFEIEKYIDRQVTFESGFLKPLSNFLDAIHWSTEEKVDLFDF